MGYEVEGKVIGKPVDIMTSGKVFKPSKKFRNKLWFEIIGIAIVIWAAITLGYLGLGYLIITKSRDGTIADYYAHVDKYLGILNQWILGIHLIWLVPVLILIPIYVNRIEYSVITESGEAMPEVYVKKGVFNVSRKHVPFRTITNISSRAGLLDRLFGIGTIEIETAGISVHKTRWGPEEKIEGIMFYEEVRDFILAELRKFRAPYTTGTEVIQPPEMADLRREDLDTELLHTLREIRDILPRMKESDTEILRALHEIRDILKSQQK